MTTKVSWCNSHFTITLEALHIFFFSVFGTVYNSTTTSFYIVNEAIFFSAPFPFSKRRTSPIIKIYTYLLLYKCVDYHARTKDRGSARKESSPSVCAFSGFTYIAAAAARLAATSQTYLSRGSECCIYWMVACKTNISLHPSTVFSFRTILKGNVFAKYIYMITVCITIND